jgi:hypothetical protein
VSDFKTLLSALKNADSRIQDEAAEKLAKLEPTVKQGLSLIAAAAKTYPNDAARTYETIGAKILRPCWHQPEEEYIEAVVANYDSFCKDENKQWQALRILTEEGSEEALTALVELLMRPSSVSASLELPLAPLIGSLWGNREPPEELASQFPRLFDLLGHLDEVHHVYELIDKCQAGGLVNFDDHPTFVALCVARAESALHLLNSQPVVESRIVNSNKEVGRATTHLEWSLDSFAAMQHPAIAALIERAIDCPIGMIRLFAVTTALARGMHVSGTTLDEIASLPPLRHRLWRLLDYRGLLDRFPHRYSNGEKLAEANMVHWLEFPTEMGKPPEQIELLHCEDLLVDLKPSKAYFFKFRHSDFCDGDWYVGFAGTYPAHGPPTLYGKGTFSRFQILESKTLQQHIADYLDAECTEQ